MCSCGHKWEEHIAGMNSPLNPGWYEVNGCFHSDAVSFHGHEVHEFCKCADFKEN